MSEFTTALERELQRLENELRQDPKFRRVQQLRALLAEYKGPEPELELTPAPQNTHNVERYRAADYVARRQRVHLSKAASVRLAIENLLRERGTVHRSHILDHLKQQSLMGQEKNPMGSLAAYLSDWKDMFEPDGHGNFSLRKKSTEGAARTAPVSH